jgi:hypothetical protein
MNFSSSDGGGKSLATSASVRYLRRAIMCVEMFIYGQELDCVGSSDKMYYVIFTLPILLNQ